MHGDGVVEIEGTCASAFASVREVFADVVAADGAGSALAVWHDGRFVVDLWGGTADAARTRPWRRDTLVMPYSVSKPLAAVPALLLVARGRLDLDAPVRDVWPEVRWDATLRQVLSHSAGVVALDRPAPTSAFLDWADLCARLAEQPPSFEPGTAVAESAWFFGHLVGEVVRRVDGRTVGTVLREDVAGRLGLDVHLGVLDADLSRIADLVATQGFPGTSGGPLRAAAIGNPPGGNDPALVNSAAWRRAEVPAINAHVTARGVAGFYADLAAGRILPPELVAELGTVQAEGEDLVVGSECHWGLGVAVEDDGFGMGGLGGSLGWWSAEGGYGFGFVTSLLAGHDRSERLENAVRSCLGLPPL